jgi:AcrR family transcriptional regulator
MARQARAEATRKKIINAAVDLFADVGYQSTGLGDIIERAEMTKGALYYHFDSKEALATAIIDEGATTALTAFRNIGEPSAPALENMIHGVFVVADLIRTDKTVRIGAQLLRAFGKFNEATVQAQSHLLAKMVNQARQAIVQGDLRDDLDPAAVGEVIVGAMLGAEMLSNLSSGGADLIERIARAWTLLLPAVTTEGSLPYFREFLARESMRQAPSVSRLKCAPYI